MKLIQFIKQEKKSTIFWSILFIITYLIILFISWEFFVLVQFIQLILLWGNAMDGDNKVNFNDNKGIFMYTNIPFILIVLLVISLIQVEGLFSSLIGSFNQWLDNE